MDKYIKVNNEHVDKIIRSELWMYDTTELKEMLKYFPAEDVAPVVHAHWIPKRQTPLGLYPFECSRCGRWETIEFPNDINNMPYCHCGAIMDEEVEK